MNWYGTGSRRGEREWEKGWEGKECYCSCTVTPHFPRSTTNSRGSTVMPAIRCFLQAVVFHLNDLPQQTLHLHWQFQHPVRSLSCICVGYKAPPFIFIYNDNMPFRYNQCRSVMTILFPLSHAWCHECMHEVTLCAAWQTPLLWIYNVHFKSSRVHWVVHWCARRLWYTRTSSYIHSFYNTYTLYHCFLL